MVCVYHEASKGALRDTLVLSFSESKTRPNRILCHALGAFQKASKLSDAFF